MVCDRPRCISDSPLKGSRSSTRVAGVFSPRHDAADVQLLSWLLLAEKMTLNCSSKLESQNRRRASACLKTVNRLRTRIPKAPLRGALGCAARVRAAASKQLAKSSHKSTGLVAAAVRNLAAGGKHHGTRQCSMAPC